MATATYTTSIRLPRKFQKQIATIAKRNNISANSAIQRFIAMGISAEEQERLEQREFYAQAKQNYEDMMSGKMPMLDLEDAFF